MSRLLRFLRGSRRLDCHQVGEILQTYLDGELDERAAGRVAEHLDDCRRCGLEAETYEQLKRSLRRERPDIEAAPVQRLREFGERLARGELDASDIPAP